MSSDIEYGAEFGEIMEMVATPPARWKVVFYNDNATSIEFVIEVLQSIFKKTLEDATEITMTIHEQGSCIAGVYTHEIAEQKASETRQYARNNGFPLQVEIEKE